MSIADILCKNGKTWTSHGTIAEKGTPKRPGFYPKCGVEFTCTKKTQKEAAYKVPKFKKKADGSWSKEPDLTAKARTQNTVKISINETNIANPDPATGKKPTMFHAEFLKKYQETDFIECGSYLFSKKPIVVKYRGANKFINITIELYGPKNNEKMLQRFYWNDNYLGTYCCI